MGDIWFIFIVIGISILVGALGLAIVERYVFNKRLRLISKGMTGKQIKELTNLNIKIISIDKEHNSFVGQIMSPLNFYRYNLYFVNGRYVRRERNYRF